VRPIAHEGVASGGRDDHSCVRGARNHRHRRRRLLASGGRDR
jgi:hypothetical protein